MKLPVSTKEIISKIEARGYRCTVSETEVFVDISCIRDSDESTVRVLLPYDTDFVGITIQKSPYYKEDYIVLEEMKEAVGKVYPKDVVGRSWEQQVKEYKLEVESKQENRPVQKNVPILIEKLWHII